MLVDDICLFILHLGLGVPETIRSAQRFSLPPASARLPISPAVEANIHLMRELMFVELIHRRKCYSAAAAHLLRLELQMNRVQTPRESAGCCVIFMLRGYICILLAYNYDSQI